MTNIDKKSPESNESYQGLDFDSLVQALAKHLGITAESLDNAFTNSLFNARKGYEKAGQCFFRLPNKTWSFETMTDDEGYITIERNDGKKYRVSTSQIKQWDRETEKMVDRTVPTISAYHVRRVLDVFSGMGHPPDSYEPLEDEDKYE